MFVHVRTACFFEIMEHGWFRVDQDPKVAGGQVHLGVLAFVPADYLPSHLQRMSRELFNWRQRVEAGQRAR